MALSSTLTDTKARHLPEKKIELRSYHTSLALGHYFAGSKAANVFLSKLSPGFLVIRASLRFSFYFYAYPQSSDGSTPIHLASSYGYMDILDILMKAVAFIVDPPPDQDGMLPIHKYEEHFLL